MTRVRASPTPAEKGSPSMYLSFAAEKNLAQYAAVNATASSLFSRVCWPVGSRRKSGDRL